MASNFCVVRFTATGTTIKVLPTLGKGKGKGKGKGNVKGKLQPKTGHEGPEGEQVYSSTLSLNSQNPGRFTPRKDPVPIIQCVRQVAVHL
jgi:hypothetical protein